MKTARLFLFAGLAGLSFLAQAESGGDRTFARMQQNLQAATQNTREEAVAGNFEPYRYGMNLDIAEVLEVSHGQGCGVVPVRMRYLDSQGAEQRLEYRSERVSCSRGL